MFYKKELDAVLREIMTRWGIPGMAVGIVQGDEIVYAEGFGVQSLESEKSVTLDSIFCIASVSKCFTATAVMQLAERGKIDLDAPVIQYLPYFEMDDERFQRMTIRQLLSHTSGMPDLDETEYDELVEHPEWDEGAAQRWIRCQSGRKLAANPGERFSYSNIGYNVLGDVIARVSGKSFETYMQKEILIPSGMPNSTFLLADVPPRLLAVPHLRAPEMIVRPIYPYHRADAPSSFLHSTVTDKCHWAITALNGGSYDGQTVLSPAGYSRMWSPVAGGGRSRTGMYEDMGLGWTMGHYRGVKTISHGGMGFGWTDFLFILPEKNCAAVILCNEESYARSRTIKAVADTLLDIHPEAGTVSWMVPISQALGEGGIQAAYAQYERMLKNPGEYEIAEHDLGNLSIQLASVKKFDLAIEILGLNLHAFPRHIESYIDQAKLYLKKGDRSGYEVCLSKALSIEPENSVLKELLMAGQ